MHPILPLLLMPVLTGLGAGHPKDVNITPDIHVLVPCQEQEILTSGTYLIDSKHTGKATVKVDMQNMKWEELDRKGQVLSRGRIEKFNGITAFFAEEVLSKKAAVVKFQFMPVSQTNGVWEVEIFITDGKSERGTLQKL